MSTGNRDNRDDAARAPLRVLGTSTPLPRPTIPERSLTSLPGRRDPSAVAATVDQRFASGRNARDLYWSCGCVEEVAKQFHDDREPLTLFRVALDFGFAHYHFSSCALPAHLTDCHQAIRLCASLGMGATRSRARHPGNETPTLWEVP